MRNLILKEYIIQKPYFQSSITYCLVLFFAFGLALRKKIGLEISPIIAGTIYFVQFMMAVSCTIDEKQNTDVFLVCLPLDRWEIVVGKFLWLLGLGAAAFTCLAGISILANVLRLNMGLPTPGGSDVLAAFTGICTLALAYLPFYFRNGLVGSRFAGILVFAGAFSAASGVHAWINGIAKSNHAEFALAILVVAGASMATIAGALGLATKFFKQRDL